MIYQTATGDPIMGRIYRDAKGTQHAIRSFAYWSDEELSVIGVVRVEPEPEPAPEPPTPEQLVAEFRAAVQAHIDATARSRQYDSGVALAGYATSQVSLWRGEAEAFIGWRDQVWLYVLELLARVQAGQVEPPESAEALIGRLPQIEWPDEGEADGA